MTPSGESDIVPRAWFFTIDAAMWTFYDDTFRGAVRQWLDLMEALEPGFAPAASGITRIKIEHNRLS